jgi:hypothetical protein
MVHESINIKRLKFILRLSAVKKVCVNIPCLRIWVTLLYSDVFIFVRTHLLVRHIAVCLHVITAFN